jgi:hypothetical protein
MNKTIKSITLGAIVFMSQLAGAEEAGYYDGSNSGFSNTGTITSPPFSSNDNNSNYSNSSSDSSSSSYYNRNEPESYSNRGGRINPHVDGIEALQRTRKDFIRLNGVR